MKLSLPILFCKSISASVSTSRCPASEVPRITDVTIRLGAARDSPPSRELSGQHGEELGETLVPGIGQGVVGQSRIRGVVRLVTAI